MDRAAIRRPRALVEADNALAVEIDRHMRRHGLNFEAVANRCRLSRRGKYRLKAWMKGSFDPDFTTLKALEVAEDLGIPVFIVVGDPARQALAA